MLRYNMRRDKMPAFFRTLSNVLFYWYKGLRTFLHATRTFDASTAIRLSFCGIILQAVMTTHSDMQRKHERRYITALPIRDSSDTGDLFQFNQNMLSQTRTHETPQVCAPLFKSHIELLPNLCLQRRQKIEAKSRARQPNQTNQPTCTCMCLS